jgi:hypothetical protein
LIAFSHPYQELFPVAGSEPVFGLEFRYLPVRGVVRVPFGVQPAGAGPYLQFPFAMAIYRQT